MLRLSGFLRPSRQATRLPGLVHPTRNVSGIPYADLTIGVPKELANLERRVAQTPESVGKLTKAGFNVLVEKGAGKLASFSDAAYVAVRHIPAPSLASTARSIPAIFSSRTR